MNLLLNLSSSQEGGIRMGRIILTLTMLLVLAGTAAFGQVSLQELTAEADQLFQKHVKEGRIDYAGVIAGPEPLNKLVGDLAGFDLTTLSTEAEKKAFWINAYNLLVVYSVIERYPMKSTQEVGGFFDRNRHNVAGEALTLNDIEHKKLLKAIPDPRYHFVLVCAAVGCPPIIPGAYFADTIEQQLQERTRKTLNDDYYVQLDNTSQKANVTELFKWYKDDFTTGGLSVAEYINQYRSVKIPANYSIGYITYDWILNDYKPASVGLQSDNLQAYTPSTLLKPGQIEVKVFNNLYTQTAFYNSDGDRQDQNGRSTFFTGIGNFLYGINSNFNVGFDLYFRSVRNDASSSSAFSVFNFGSGTNSRYAFSQIGPKLKISPFSGLRNLSFQTTFLVPLTSNLDGRDGSGQPFLDVNGTQWWTQVFYDQPFKDNFLVYFEGGLLFRFDSPFDDFYTPLKAILNYYPSQRWTVYAPAEFTSFWKDQTVNAWYGQLGLGTKYQFTSNFELEVLYTNFVAGKSQGAGQTFNLGFRIIR